MKCPGFFSQVTNNTRFTIHTLGLWKKIVCLQICHGGQGLLSVVPEGTVLVSCPLLSKFITYNNISCLYILFFFKMSVPMTVTEGFEKLLSAEKIEEIIRRVCGWALLNGKKSSKKGLCKK